MIPAVEEEKRRERGWTRCDARIRFENRRARIAREEDRAEEQHYYECCPSWVGDETAEIGKNDDALDRACS